MNRTYLTKSEQVFLFALVFIVLQEWLKPVMQLTGTGYFGLFSVFMALCLVLSLFELPFTVTFPVKLAYILWAINRIYNDGIYSFFGFYQHELSQNIEAIRFSEWGYVTNGLRTFLFFLLIWMLVYLIHHWITVRMSIFYFLVMTVFFIATLDTFTDYDGKNAIIKVLLVGLVMTSMLFIKRFILKRNIFIDFHSVSIMILPVVVLVALFGILAYNLPKSAPQWPDPIAFVKNGGITNGEGGLSFSGGTKKVGYGDNDEKLGGSFVADDTIVFQVETEVRQYWRVESKDTYTSKGWINSVKNPDERVVEDGENIEFSIPPSDEGEAKIAKVTNLSNHMFFLQPYGVTSYGTNGQRMTFNPLTEKVRLFQASAPIAEYVAVYSEPIYYYDELKKIPVVHQENMDNYLQLPDTLPERVRNLAEEITANFSTAYDKAKAIESYFSGNGFSYETKNVAVPGRDEDYVDQFLFDTKVGYCDNFSSAMVVMLRSVDIPARWVKGFVTGDFVEQNDDGSMLYNITNNEAHSWVEAYIDGVGWVPFEPTIGYTNPINLSFEALPDEYEEEQPELKEEQKEEEQEELEQPSTSDEQQNSQEEKWNFSWSMMKIPAIVLGLLLVASSIVLWFTRKKWLPKYYIRQYRKKAPSEEKYVTAYDRLLKQLADYGLERSKEQTLSSYAKVVDEHFGTDHMSRLTEVYERLIYSKNIDSAEFEEMFESWEYLINHATS